MSEPQPESDRDTDRNAPHAGALLTTDVPYMCRNCGTEIPVYVTVEPVEGEPRTVELPSPHNVRLLCRKCDECGTDRTFVLNIGGADEPRDGAPIHDDEVGI